MQQNNNIYTKQLEKNDVLSKAVLRLAEAWELNGQQLADMLGVSASSISRLKQGESILSPNKNEGKIALLLIRIFRSLGAFLGDRIDAHQQWLNAHNFAFNTTPLQAMSTVQGLTDVVRYLDAMRGTEG